MTKKQGNICLDALEYGEKQLIKRQQIEKKDLKKHLEDKGYKFSTKEEIRLLGDIEIEAFYMYAGEPSNRKYYLNIESYFKFLEYRELNDARKSSLEARWFAIVAIGLTILTLALSIHSSRRSLEQKTVMDDKQFGVIESIWHKLESMGSKKYNKL